MSEQAPNTIFLQDYTAPNFLVDSVDLHFDLDENATTVDCRMTLKRNPERQGNHPLVLNGCDLQLDSLLVDDESVPPERYKIAGEDLTIADVPDAFTLATRTRINPRENTSLEGLYKSGDMFCTQCEAEGFRKITYFPDRPDVMSRYTTTIVADRDRYPVLLSNGNPVDSGTSEGNRHWVRWEDPFRKPSYLFALVAGDLVTIEDSFTTRSGRQVALRIYVEPVNAEKCDHAMRSLKNAMRWDEETFGLEYDLDIYMIVAVDNFNAGAMENKGLNIFNSKYVLARPETATDTDFVNVEGVIGHEYFHNWTGNRVTCRDWFQLSLKEGLTVFRDQEFSCDMASRAVKRISDVRHLRTAQFAEDASPMAHPVRPDSYIEISNFYTLTVYQKGAEVIRMIHTLLGREGFRKGMDLYIERHDGQAVTTDDFVSAMEDANDADLGQFRLWYSQAGTPELTVEDDYDADDGVYALTLRQSTPPTPGQEQKQPLHIPVAMALLDGQGNQVPLRLEGETTAGDASRVLELREAEQVYRFTGLAERPLPSLLRGFSAPVKLNAAYTDEQLAVLLAKDSDPFNRWDASQRLALKCLLDLVADHQQQRTLALPEHLVGAYAEVLQDQALDKSLKAETLALPSEAYLAEQMETVDVDGIHATRLFARRTLAEKLQAQFREVFHANLEDGPYVMSPEAMGRRSLKNMCLGYLMELETPEIRSLCLDQFNDAGNMTDTMSSLSFLTNCDCPERGEALSSFYTRWKDDPLLVDKWFSVQALSRLPGTLAEVCKLLEQPAFDIKNPNRVRSLVGAFCHANGVRFHDASGAGYSFLADQVLRLDKLNPQVAARMIGALSRWRRFDSARGQLMRAELERGAAAEEISNDTYEVVSKSLA